MHFFLINKICMGKNEQELNFNVRCNNYKGQLFENNSDVLSFFIDISDHLNGCSRCTNQKHRSLYFTFIIFIPVFYQ